MLAVRTEGLHGPWIILLHWLGGSGCTWSEVSSLASKRGYRVASIDLPGFGGSADLSCYSVEAMVAAAVETIQAIRASKAPADATSAWLLAGHSLGGKVAAVVASLAAAGEPSLSGLQGLFLVSPSPAGPEPMKESKRVELLQSLGTRSAEEMEDRKRIVSFLHDNVGKLALPGELQTRAEDDFLRINRSAFRHWLNEGSKEDWSERVGVLPYAALILAGSKETELGPDAQQKHTSPHFASAEVLTLRGSGHLAPLERPGEVALHLREFARRVGVKPAKSEEALSVQFQTLLNVPLTSPQTRSVMKARLPGESPSLSPHGVTPDDTLEESFLLEAFVSSVLPEAPPEIAMRLRQRLASGTGDGWRYATLPADREAWLKGLRTLDHAAEATYGVPFIALWPDQQSALLTESCAGDLGKGVLGSLRIGARAESYTAAEMKQWFEEARGELAKLYMSDPRTMERVGFTGFADEAGFTQIRLGETEGFEV